MYNFKQIKVPNNYIVHASYLTTGKKHIKVVPKVLPPSTINIYLEGSFTLSSPEDSCNIIAPATSLDSSISSIYSYDDITITEEATDSFCVRYCVDVVQSRISTYSIHTILNMYELQQPSSLVLVIAGSILYNNTVYNKGSVFVSDISNSITCTSEAKIFVASK